jgi:hypothetical protein
VGSTPLRAVQFDISDFGFEVQDSSNFQFPFGMRAGFVKYIDAIPAFLYLRPMGNIMSDNDSYI